MAALNIKLYDLFRKELKLSDDVAREFVTVISEEISQVNNKAATKEFGKDELHRLGLQTYKVIFWSGLLQALAVFWRLNCHY